MQSILGAVLTAGYASAVGAAIAASPNKDEITNTVQTELTDRSRARPRPRSAIQSTRARSWPPPSRRSCKGDDWAYVAGIVAILLGRGARLLPVPQEGGGGGAARPVPRRGPAAGAGTHRRVPRPSRDQDASLIGHALAVAPRRASGEAWDRWIAAGFAVGSTCFLIGPFPGFVQLVGEGADGVVFFAGSVFFTLAAALEVQGVNAAAGAVGCRPLLVERGNPVRRAPCCSTSAPTTPCRTGCRPSSRTGWSGLPTSSVRGASSSPGRSPTGWRAARGCARSAGTGRGGWRR